MAHPLSAPAYPTLYFLRSPQLLQSTFEDVIQNQLLPGFRAFPAFDTGWMFSRHRLHVLRTWHRFHLFPRLASVA